MGCTCAEANRKNQKMKLPTQNILNNQNYKLNKINNMQTPQQKGAINSQYNNFNNGTFNNQLRGNSYLTGQRQISAIEQNQMINAQIMLSRQQLENNKTNNIMNNKVMNKPKKYYNLQIDHFISYNYILEEAHGIIFPNEDDLYESGKNNAKSSDNNNEIDDYNENSNDNYNRDNEDNINIDHYSNNNSNANEREQESNRNDLFSNEESGNFNEEISVEEFESFIFLLYFFPFIFPVFFFPDHERSRSNHLMFTDEMLCKFNCFC